MKNNSRLCGKFGTAADKDPCMERKKEDVAATIGRNEDVVDMLDMLLTDPGDRAYVVCTAYECQNNAKGQCTIHAVKGKRKILSNGRCVEYEI